MTRPIIALGIIMFAGTPLRADRITWFSDAGATNQTSTPGQLMDAGFRFELGVFDDSFTPLATNKELWAQHWRPAMRTTYDPIENRYLATHEFSDNDPPFSVGKPGYIWGFRGDALVGEWILFRASTWNWPIYSPLNPQPPFWGASAATEVLAGEINGVGFLMKSEAVTNAAPPSTTWELWQEEYLTEEPLDGPGDDPDRDGVSNLMEFVFGTLPTSAGAPPHTPVTLVEIEGSKHLQITIPRRIDHTATLVVEVSSDLTNWSSGTAHTVVVSNGPANLVVRDKTAFAPPVATRFMRLRATLP